MNSHNGKYYPLTEEVVERQEEPWIDRGVRKGIIELSDDKKRIVYRCANPGGTFSDDYSNPEEKIRADLFVQLVEKYKYPIHRIWVEKHVTDRRPDYPADIIVYTDDELKTPYLLAETKKTDISDNEFEKAIEQGFENAHLVGGADIVVIDSGTSRDVFDYKNFPPGERIKNVIRDIPITYGDIPEYRFIKGSAIWDLKTTDFSSLKRRFNKCHDAIWQGGKLDPAQAFDEMSKLMFAKYWDELRYTKNKEFYRFQIGTKEDKETVASRVTEVYNNARTKKIDVFGEDLKIPPQVIYEVVGILEDISLKKTDLDAKGRAFETFLSDMFRGKMGQFFTKREIVTFMVNIINPDWDDKIIDPACGSGGFLLYSWDHVRKRLIRDHDDDIDTIKKLSWDFSRNHIFGIEVNDRIARIAMMDMVIHEDGSSNIVCDDSLKSFQNLSNDKIVPGGFNICITNPPFAGVVRDQDILSLYELGSKISKKPKQKTEILFIERCLDLLEPGGKLGIVLPQGILTNLTVGYVRKYIERNGRILAIVSLPAHAFTPAGAAVKTSLVFIKKYTDDEKSEFDEAFRTSVEVINKKYDPIISKEETRIKEENESMREEVEKRIRSEATIIERIESALERRKSSIERIVKKKLQNDCDGCKILKRDLDKAIMTELERLKNSQIDKIVTRILQKEQKKKLLLYQKEVQSTITSEIWGQVRKQLNYPIFMAIVDHVGYDSTDRPDRNELFEVDDNGRIKEESGVLGEYRKFLKNPSKYRGVKV